MRPVLVGSRALEYWQAPKFTCRPNADWDVLVEDRFVFEHPSVADRPCRVEWHTFDELNNRALCEEFHDGHELVDVNGVECTVMSLAGLAIMKRSHLWRAYHFEKHITMYHKHLVRWMPNYHEAQDLLKERIKLTKKAYPQRNPSLKQTNDDFFDDFVEKEFEHDWIHELVAYYDRPLFERLKQPDNLDDAWCERDLWDAFSPEDRNKCVAEETHVIACERFMIPTKWTHDSKHAYFKALNKVCTTLTSGFFRSWAIDHFPEIVSLYNPTKFEVVKAATKK